MRFFVCLLFKKKLKEFKKILKSLKNPISFESWQINNNQDQISCKKTRS